MSSRGMSLSKKDPKFTKFDNSNPLDFFTALDAFTNKNKVLFYKMLVKFVNKTLWKCLNDIKVAMDKKNYNKFC